MKREILFLSALALVYIAVFSALSVLKHRAFNSTYLDLGLEAQSIWNTTRGRPLVVSFGGHGEEISALSYHVSPIIIFLAPLYRLWPSVEILLTVQTVILALGIIPLYLLFRGTLDSVPLSFAVVVSYLLYPPLQWSNLTDFHPQTLATSLLLAVFYFSYIKKWLWFWLFAVLALTVKENIALVLFTLGLYLVAVSWLKARGPSGSRRVKRWRTALFSNGGVNGVFLALLSLVWFIIALYIVMPYFSGGGMGALGRYEYLGNTPWQIGLKVLTDPLGDLRTLLVTPKIKYLFHLLVSSGFLPLLAPQYLLLSISEYFLNLFSAYNPQWQVKFHYTAAITPFIFIAAIFGIARLQRLMKRFIPQLLSPPVVTSVYLVMISGLWNYVHSPSPINREFNRSTYTVTASAAEKEKVLRSIPESASVSAMNNLGPHLANRRWLWRFPININEADFVVVDPTLPGRNYDLSQMDKAEFEKLWGSLLTDYRYTIYYQAEGLFILEKTQ